MSQYARLFCSTRIPEVKKDRLATFENARHMVVMRKGNFYVFDTITTDGKNLNKLCVELIMDNRKTSLSTIHELINIYMEF